jgi:hypothetical protein
MSSNLQAKLNRQRAFWSRENHDRPVIGFTGSYFSTDTIRMLKRTEGRLTPQDIDEEGFLEDCDAQFAAWQGCTGDLCWTANVLWRLRWLAGAIGQPLHVSGDTIWADPILDDYSHLDRLAVTGDNEWIETLWKLTNALVEHAAGRYPVGANMFSGPLTTLVDARGSQQLALDLYDHPDEVGRAMELLTETWVRLVVAHFEMLPAWHGGYASVERFIWAPGRVIEFDEDPAFMFSPRFHQQFIMPSHRELIRHVEYPYIHLHSTQLHTLDHLLELDALPAIELTPDHGDSIPDLIPAIARIQARKPVIVHGYLSAEEVRMIVERVPPEGLCVVSRVDTPEGALRLQDAILY